MLLFVVVLVILVALIWLTIIKTVLRWIGREIAVGIKEKQNDL